MHASHRDSPVDRATVKLPERDRTASEDRRSTSLAVSVAAASVNTTEVTSRRSIFLDLVVLAVARLATRLGYRPTLDRPESASQGLSSLLAMQGPQTRAGEAERHARRETSVGRNLQSGPARRAASRPRSKLPKTFFSARKILPWRMQREGFEYFQWNGLASFE